MQRWGVLQPIVVRKGGAKAWQIVHGERRWRCAQLAGLQTIPAFVETGAGEDRLARQVVENQHRQSLPNSAIGRVIEVMTQASERNADIATVVNLPEHQLKYYRVIPQIPPALAQWVDRLDMRTVYELFMAWTRADGQGRAGLQAKLAAVDGETGLSLADARRIIHASVAAIDVEDGADGSNAGSSDEARADSSARPSSRPPARREIARLEGVITRLLDIVEYAAATLERHEELRAQASQIRASARQVADRAEIPPGHEQ
jgi:hypothetical protein